MWVAASFAEAVLVTREAAWRPFLLLLFPFTVAIGFCCLFLMTGGPSIALLSGSEVSEERVG